MRHWPGIYSKAWASAVLSLLLVLAATAPAFAGVTSVTLFSPGAGTYGEHDDYFTTVWGNPRDMDDTYDLYVLHSSCPPGPAGARAKWTGMSFTNGVWRGTTSSVGESRSLYVLNPGWVSSLDTGEDGELRKVDTSRYRQLTWRMRIQAGAGNTDQTIHWANGPLGTTPIRGFRVFRARSDGLWHVYTSDLSPDPAWTSGPVTTLVIDLSGLNAGYLVEIDWVRLTPVQQYQIRWDGTALSGTASVFLGSDAAKPEEYGDLLIYDQGTHLPRSVLAADKSLLVPASYPPGRYYARVEAGGSGATSAGSWSFVPIPIARIDAPSYTSGADYAAAVLGNAWDMNGLDDVDTSDPQKTSGIKSLSVGGGILTIVSTDDGQDICSASWPHRPLALNMHGRTVDSNQYRYFTYRYRVANAPDQGAGGVSRVRWQQQAGPWWPTGRTDDISLYDSGWHTYSLDLSTVPLEAEGGKWGDFPVDTMQIMVHESHREWMSYLDWAKLTAENTASSSYTVEWTLVNVSDVLTTTIYWATAPDQGHTIGSGYVVPRPSPPPSLPHKLFLPLALRGYPGSGAQWSYTIGTGGLVTDNRYYVAIKLDDACHTVWWYSEVPVRKL